MLSRTACMGLLAAAFLLLGAAKPHDDEDYQWTEFKLRYNKTYSSDVEEQFREKVFQENQRKITLHNEKYNQGVFTYKVKVNQYGDMMFEEYKNYMHIDNKSETEYLAKRKRFPPRGEIFVKPNGTLDLPDIVDWRQKGAVTSVHDQGLICGSCWAFASTGALESQYFIKTGVLTALSAQKLIDCTTEYGNQGCRGGSTAISFQFVANHPGLEPEANYSYEGRIGQCPFNFSGDSAEQFKPSFVYVDNADETDLKIALATVGPLSAAIDASHDTFRFYSEGIYYQEECSNVELDHAILIIGYGTDTKTQLDYWLVKNSWGETWGEAGYFKIARNRSNHCGIANYAMYPIVYL